MIAEDLLYFQQRAETEAALARQARQPCAAQVHQQLAEAYREKLAVLRLRQPVQS